MLRSLVPCFVFVGLVLLFIFGLHNDPKLVPSAFIDNPVPTFELPALRDDNLSLSSAMM